MRAALTPSKSKSVLYRTPLPMANITKLTLPSKHPFQPVLKPLQKGCALVALCMVSVLTLLPTGSTSSNESVAQTPSLPRAPRVLVLYSQRKELPICELWGRGIRKGLESNLGRQIVIDSEYLDIDRLVSLDERQTLLKLVLAKYNSIKPDIIIPVQDGITQLFVRHNPFPESAVVVCSILDSTREQIPANSNMTGVVFQFDAKRTAQQALELFPSTKTAVIVSGSAEADSLLLEAIKPELNTLNHLRIEYWTGLSVDTLTQRVSELPPDNIVIFNNYLFDQSSSVDTVPRDVLKRITASSSVPVFALFDAMMGTGVVGGCMPMVEEQGRMAGEIAARILNGENASEIPFAGRDLNRFIFDWNQLRRWNIDEQRLPLGSVVLFRQDSFWAVNRTYLIAGGIAFVLQSLLIATLLLQRRTRARAESALAASRSDAELLAGRILTSVEEERKRISRELHDDISQRLAAGAMQVGRLEQEFSNSETPQANARQLKQQLIELSQDVHRLSRQLHPSILKDLGLSEALRSECNRAAERGPFIVMFQCGKLPDSLHQETQLCIYRIVQEALNNIVKHAQTPRVELTLNADLEFLELEIKDFGCGFKHNEGHQHHGLGLQSMRERVRLVHGEFSISTAPDQGTYIQVRIPLENHP